VSTWAWLIATPEMVRGRALSSDSDAPREGRVDSPGELLVPAVQYGLMQRMAALVEDSNDAIISVAGEGTVASWNRAAECIFGYTEQEMLGQPIFRLACAGEEGAMSAVLDQVRNGRRLDHYETRRRCKDGSEIPVSLTVSPIRNAAGKIAGVSEVARDIARQKRAEEAVRISEKLEAVGRLASSVAHHINNPLAAVTNLLFLLQNEDLSPEGKHHLATAHRELSRLTHIATQALGFRRNTGEAVWASIPAILDEALALHDNRIDVTGIEVLRDYDATLRLRCHPGELRQVMVNMMGNAIDAMPFGGRLQLRVRRVTDGKAACPGICITIADNGRGMSPVTLRHAFEPFYTTKDRIGTGLGLWICAEIVSRYRGRISTRSNDSPGHSGSVFRVFLPL
jgi:PAS domain S-box-containing protein